MLLKFNKIAVDNELLLVPFGGDTNFAGPPQREGQPLTKLPESDVQRPRSPYINKPLNGNRNRKYLENVCFHMNYFGFRSS